MTAPNISIPSEFFLEKKDADGDWQVVKTVTAVSREHAMQILNLTSKDLGNNHHRLTWEGTPCGK